MTSNWYIVHAYSNFEKKVADAILLSAKEKGLEALIEEVYVPTEEVTEVRRGPVEELLERELAVIVLADSSPLSDSDRERIAGWIGEGGVAVRFAGPRLAEGAESAGPEALLPVLLRDGGRTLGGALSCRQ